MNPECTIRFADRSKGPVCILRYAKTAAIVAAFRQFAEQIGETA